MKARENRIPIMMSDEELTAIDDWRFANRVATRSDAVRKLAAISLIFDSQVSLLTSELNEMWRVREIGHDSIATELDGDPNWEKVAAKAIGTLSAMIEPQTVLSEKLFAILHQVALLKSSTDLRDSLVAAEQAKNASQEKLAAMQAAFADTEGDAR